jgi:hypothetical protein
MDKALDLACEDTVILMVCCLHANEQQELYNMASPSY